MSLTRMTRRRRKPSSPDKPQIERIEHANLNHPGARPHPRADTARYPLTPRLRCKSERPSA
jgi:hypothetical protein